MQDLPSAVASALLFDGLDTASSLIPEQNNSILGKRARVWKLLLRVSSITPKAYVELVKMKKAEKYGKIKDDDFRTFSNNKAFNARVKVETINRFLNATANYLEKPNVSPYGLYTNVGYIQGMNALAGIILYVFADEDGVEIQPKNGNERKAFELIRETEAFSCFIRILTCCVPMYIQLNVDGAHAAVTLIDNYIIKEVDLELYQRFCSCSTKPDGQVWAFKYIVMFSSDSPDLEDVVEVWDMLVAKGFYMIPLVLVARLELIRDSFLTMKEDDIYPKLMDLPPYKGKDVVDESLKLEKRLNKKVIDLLHKHLFDPEIVVKLLPKMLKSNVERFKSGFMKE